MSGLILPYHVRRERARQVPDGDLRLKSGRFLKYLGDWPTPADVQRGVLLGCPLETEHILSGAHWQEQRKNGLAVIATIDDTRRHGILLHVSCAYPDHEPTWRDIRDVRDTLFPADIDVMMLLPQERDYVSLHPHAFHLWQTPTEWGLQ